MRRRSALVAAAVVLGAWCGWVSGFHRTTVAAEATWAISTVAVVALDVALWRRRPRELAAAWPRPGRGGSRRALVGVSPWLVLLVVALAWDVLGIDTGPHQYHLTISALAQAYRPLNAALLLVWLLVGIGYELARRRAPGPALTAQTEQTAPTAAEGTVGGEGDGGGGGGGGGLPGAGGRGVGLAGLAAHPGAVAPSLLLPASPPAGVAFWVAVPVGAVAIDVMARRSAGRFATAEELVRFISTARWANVLLIAAWLVAGYHLFAR